MAAGVLGIDAGTFSSPSWLAFLRGRRFTLSIHQFTASDVSLLWLRDGEVRYVAVDALQGLPRRGEKVRLCDKLVRAPTKKLPHTLKELNEKRFVDGRRIPYAGLIQLGCSLFWENRDHLYGLPGSTGRLCETYPHYVFRTLGGEAPAPKRKHPVTYVRQVYGAIKRWGYICEGVELASVDQCDAMLCALAALALSQGEGRYQRIGLPPEEEAELIREGYVISPR